MTIEEHVFQRYRPNFSYLKQAGFVKMGNEYHLKQEFFDGQFRAELIVDLTGQVSGKVIDTATGMEYLPLRAAHLGAFAREVRDKYLKLLQKIADRCFIDEPFVTDQANWLSSQIEETYNDHPEFVFVRFPHTALFREPEFKKWYAVISDVKRNQVVNNDPHGQGKLISALNFRVDSPQRQHLLQLPGVYPAYGTVKQNWLSLILDGTQDNQTVWKLLQQSHELLTKPKYWLIPANPKYFDIMHAFDHTDTIDWKQSANIRVGDTVFMYVTAPIKAIIYQCRVIKNNLPYEYQNKNLRIKRVMKVQLIRRFPANRFNLDFLRNNGVKYIRGPRHLTGEALKSLSRN